MILSSSGIAPDMDDCGYPIKADEGVICLNRVGERVPHSDVRFGLKDRGVNKHHSALAGFSFSQTVQRQPGLLLISQELCRRFPGP